jgi:hypothetical protein
MKRIHDDRYEELWSIKAHSDKIDSLTINHTNSTIATSCRHEHKVKLWDTKQGL